MTDIYCSVTKCAHNKEHCCCLENVKVGGENANSTEGTRCDSFIKEHATMSLGESICHCTLIDCEAENCRYNCEGECCAESIDICGEKSCNCGETCCTTFKL